MAREVREFVVTIPAGTAKASPITVPMTFPPRQVNEIDVVIPSGPAGHMGFQIAAAGTAIIPANGGWIIADDDKKQWPLYGVHDSGSWEVIGYNTGTYDHTIYVSFLLDLTTDTGILSSVPVPIDATLITPTTTS